MPITDDFRDHKYQISGSPIASQSKTFNVAFGLSDFHDQPDAIEDVNYGALLPYLMKRADSGVFEYEMLDWAPCTEDYLNQNLFAAESRHTQNAKFNIKKLKCLNLNNSPVELFGDFNTPGSSMLSIFFASCDRLNVATCKTPDEVTAWLKHKYVLLYYTEDRPNEAKNSKEGIHYSTFQQLPVNRFVDTNHRFQIQEQNYDGKDYYNVVRLPD